MKRFLILLTFCFSLASFSSFAQDLKGEVRGLETRRTGSEPYSWEITNYNKEAVSVDLSVYQSVVFGQTTVKDVKLDSKSIILKPGEKYNFSSGTYKSTDKVWDCYLEYKAHIFTGTLPS